MYQDLVALFHDWRAFEAPQWRDGAPDYGAAAMAEKHRALADYHARLAAIDPGSWPIAQQVDYHLVRAEMNGMDFNIRVLKPWARDPAFYATVWTYQSDTPAHEGPTGHALVELWSYDFPLDAEAAKKLAGELRTIPPLLSQARENLTGNARDLWISGIDTVRGQRAALQELEEKITGAGGELRAAAEAARAATEGFITWLEEEAASKTGPSGVGRENYSWYLKNVHLVPLDWEDEVRLLKRELARAHASLRLEEHRNRDLPPMPVISSPEDYERRANEAVSKYVAFLGKTTCSRSKTIWTRRCARGSAHMRPRRRVISSPWRPTASR